MHSFNKKCLHFKRFNELSTHSTKYFCILKGSMSSFLSSNVKINNLLHIIYWFFFLSWVNMHHVYLTKVRKFNVLYTNLTNYYFFLPSIFHNWHLLKGLLGATFQYWQYLLVQWFLPQADNITTHREFIGYTQSFDCYCRKKIH